MNVLEVRIGEPVKTSLARYPKALRHAKAGKSVKPYFGVGFRNEIDVRWPLQDAA